MLDNKGKKDKSKVVRRPTPTAPHRPSINTSSSHNSSELGPGRGNLPQRSLSPATSRPHPALMARSRPSTSPSTTTSAASWRSPSSASATAPDLSPHAKTKALGGHKSKTGSAANPEIMKRSLRWAGHYHQDYKSDSNIKFYSQKEHI